ncbi:Rv3235 family protein [[Pseudopropionibacterium] massiliense]|uniref:Rv3235 family protein n=1 Tax=[Pseudopropionibacterium] massiliense TaxID=2220000 RepID=UPI003CCC7C8E
MNQIPAPTLAQAVLDAIQGTRALHQIRPHLSSRAFRQLVSYSDATSFRVGRVGPLHVQHPAPDSLEASSTVQIQGRWLACTIRLDREEDWLCSDLRVVGFPA